MTRRENGRGRPEYEYDVRDPLYREAEDRVHNWLVSQGKLVADNRDQHTFHDFTVGHAWTLDVKADTYGYENGHVAWEQGIAHHNGRVREGWGLHPGLSYVAYVLVPPVSVRERVPWPVVLCNAARLRSFVEEHRETDVCRGFVVYGTDRDGFGFILDLGALREYGAVLQEGEV